MPGMSVLEHGVSVNQYFNDLRNHVLYGDPLAYQWKLPDWVFAPELWSSLPDDDIIRLYQIYHDCGKPFCREVDEQGRTHFPCHAEKSKEVWLQYSSDREVAELIGMDMDIHLLKDDDCLEFSQRPQAALLLLTGLSEVHSNAAMFGGIDSTSFKIKWKHTNKRGKKIAAQLQSL